MVELGNGLKFSPLKALAIAVVFIAAYFLIRIVFF
jgi:hypothetical protein